MTNQELQIKSNELKELLGKELRDLEYKRQFVREAELKIELLEKEINAIKTELKTAFPPEELD